MTQIWNAGEYESHGRFISDLGAPLIDLLKPRPGESVLDLACGDGALTERLAASGARVVGVDNAPDFVAAATARGIDARLMDAHALDLPERFDGIFTNAALHWMHDPDAVVAGVHRHARPGARFVGEFGGFGNVAAIVTAVIAVLDRRGIDGAARHPWYNPTTEEFAALLAKHGFDAEDIALIPRPTPLPTGIAQWIRMFCGLFFSGLDDDARADAVREVEDLLRPSLCDRNGTWYADYVRLRFRAVAVAA